MWIHKLASDHNIRRFFFPFFGWSFYRFPLILCCLDQNGIRAANSSAFMQSSSHHTVFLGIYDKRITALRISKTCTLLNVCACACIWIANCYMRGHVSMLRICVCLCIFWWVVTKVLKCYAMHVARSARTQTHTVHSNPSASALPRTLYLYPLWKAHVFPLDGMYWDIVYPLRCIHTVCRGGSTTRQMLVHGGLSNSHIFRRMADVDGDVTYKHPLFKLKRVNDKPRPSIF